MVETLLTENGELLWQDLHLPTPEELKSVAAQYNLPPEAIRDCMDTKHLPKFEQLGSTTFIIVRTYDPASSPEAHTYTGMTRKLAVFLGDRFLITIHRGAQPVLKSIAQKHASKENPVLQVVLMEILLEAVETYHRPLETMELLVNRYESSLLRRGEQSLNWAGLFRTKCRLMVIKRMLWHILNSVQKFMPHSSSNLTQRQDLLERVENLQFFCDSLLDDLANLLSVQLALFSNRTNQVMKVLTVFSAFFLPLTFIVGVYGMNFRYMPELDWRYGYPLVWIFMIGVVAVVSLLFRRLGFFTRKKRKSPGDPPPFKPNLKNPLHAAEKRFLQTKMKLKDKR